VILAVDLILFILFFLVFIHHNFIFFFIWFLLIISGRGGKELGKQELDHLLKEGAYGALHGADLLDDKDSSAAQFETSTIDEILNSARTIKYSTGIYVYLFIFLFIYLYLFIFIFIYLYLFIFFFCCC
jgi:hypothetical protein